MQHQRSMARRGDISDIAGAISNAATATLQAAHGSAA